MLESLILKMGKGVAYGSSALKALQNDNLPELDLLVREAIQNSSDAAIDQPGDSCKINFTQGSFCPANFNSFLSDIGTVLNEKFPEQEADFLEIRDSKTSGLTGPICEKDIDLDDHGNFYKLVFDTGKEQTNSNSGEAGGSWGYGKSVYYRVGIGLVVFYSQIFENGEYKSRLIVSLIENENDKESLLKQVVGNAVGRAWWGIKGDEDGELLPVTAECEIDKLLTAFSIKRFNPTETGTSIIIPYIDKKKLLTGIFPENCGIPEDEISMCTFKDDIAQYIDLAVQKWYAPRIFNKKLKDFSTQKWLAIRVNGVPITDTSMRPFFMLVQDLYTTALSANQSAHDRYQSIRFPFIKCIEIPSNKLVSGKAGHVAFIRTTKDEMGMMGSAIEPYTYLRLFGKTSKNDPIVMFARTPGMILDYKIDDKWSKGLIKPENDDEYVFAFFVPNCSVKLKENSAAGDLSGKPFGEYLRKSEKSDHMDWIDPSSFTLITNIKMQISAKVNEALRSVEEGPVEGTASKLSGKIGRRLLPTVKFGKKKPGPGGAGGSGGSGGSLNNFELILGDKVYIDDSIAIDFTAKFSNIKKKVILEVFIEAEASLLDCEAWKNNIGTEFPITLSTVRKVKTIAKNSGIELPVAKDCCISSPVQESEYTRIKIFNNDDTENMCAIMIENSISNAIVSGQLVIKTQDKRYRCIIKETKK